MAVTKAKPARKNSTAQKMTSTPSASLAELQALGKKKTTQYLHARNTTVKYQQQVANAQKWFASFSADRPQSVLTPENVFRDTSVSYMGTLCYSWQRRPLDSIHQLGYTWATALPVDISKAASASATAAYSVPSPATRPLSSSRPTHIQSERRPAPRLRHAALDSGLGVSTSLSNATSLTEAPAVVPHTIVPVI
ncbi:hypothetical protein OE88DRAFT_1734148 [Heliocybe sulcata]|uniref:Uncharacterized protein n=1 Tax=Heliocybe sulcata TaxID=5364 RepID=A0A5C3N5X5_9AGAM|nr:hypothetical protein OE88DRAFT_1734148 [Heliocybe sulcata]